MARILAVDDDMGIRQSRAERLIRHEADFLLKNNSVNRSQNQAGNAAANCKAS